MLAIKKICVSLCKLLPICSHVGAKLDPDLWPGVLWHQLLSACWLSSPCSETRDFRVQQSTENVLNVLFVDRHPECFTNELFYTSTHLISHLRCVCACVKTGTLNKYAQLILNSPGGLNGFICQSICFLFISLCLQSEGYITKLQDDYKTLV